MTENAFKAAQDNLKDVLRKYVTDNFLPQSGLDGFLDDDSFMEKGLIDSTGVLELLEFLEEKFCIKIEDDEVIPANLDSLEKLTQFIEKKTKHAGQ